MSLYIVKAKKTKLKANLSASASQITLDELVDSQGNAVVTASFGEWFVLVVKQGDQIEMIKCTAVTQNPNGSATITVATTGRNLLPVFPYVGVATGYSFLSGAEVIVTNDPLTVMSFTNKKNDETVEGLWTFNQTPIGLNAGAVNDASTTAKGIGRASANPSRTLGTVTMTIASPAVFTKTSHGLTVNDMVKFTTTVTLPTGIVAGTTYYVIATGLTANDFQLSTAQGGSAVNTSGSQSGVHTLYKVTPVFVVDTATFYAENNTATSTGSADAYILTLSNAPTSYVQGQLYSFKANFTNTTTCTLNVNGLGAKTIKKQGGSADLVAGDILSGNTVDVRYDGTNFAMISPIAPAPASASQFKQGGTGVDGALTISSGTTNIDLGGVAIFVKNYTSISITGTGALTFTNPHASGTIIALKSTGGITITSSANPVIDMRNLGSTGGAAGNLGTSGIGGGGCGGASGAGNGTNVSGGTATAGATAGINGTVGTAQFATITGGEGGTVTSTTKLGGVVSSTPKLGTTIIAKGMPIAVGTGGGGAGGTNNASGSTSGAGGRGAGSLYLECAGAFNFTSGTINLAGTQGGAGASSFGLGGGGGGGGTFLAIVGSITSNSGTITTTGGAGGTGTSGAGGAGANGQSLVFLNADFA